MIEALAEMAAEHSEIRQDQGFCETSELSENDRLDDNGHEYRDESGGWIPNNTYELDGHVYETDDNGSIYRVDGKYFPDDIFVLDDTVYETDENGNLINEAPDQTASRGACEMVGPSQLESPLADMGKPDWQQVNEADGKQLQGYDNGNGTADWFTDDGTYIYTTDTP